MEINNQVVLFFQELILRFGSKTPKFFKTLRTILAVATVVAALPQILLYLGVDISQSLSLVSKLTSLASFVSMVLTNLPVVTTEILTLPDVNSFVDKNVLIETKPEIVYLPFSEIFAKQ